MDVFILLLDNLGDILKRVTPNGLNYGRTGLKRVFFFNKVRLLKEKNKDFSFNNFF